MKFWLLTILPLQQIISLQTSKIEIQVVKQSVEMVSFMNNNNGDIVP